jgi:hypothetical protein
LNLPDTTGRSQVRLAYPLLDLSHFRDAAFSAATAATLSYLAVFGVCTFITQYVQMVLGLKPLRTRRGDCNTELSACRQSRKGRHVRSKEQ